MRTQKHLILLVHGLFGNPGHMDCMAAVMKDVFAEDESIKLHVSSTCSGMKTFDGVEVGAERVLAELYEVVQKMKEDDEEIAKISIIGYSMGGLVSRYLIGLLEEGNFFETVQPMVFATFATPHVGTKFHSTKLKARILNFLGKTLFGVSGSDLFSVSSVVSDLCDPTQKYMLGLGKFRRLYTIANALNDRTVPFWTSFITTKNPFRNPEDLKLCFYDFTNTEDDSKADSKASSDSGSKPKSKSPILPYVIDTENSKYIKGQPILRPKKTKMERFRPYVIVFILPLFFPILISILCYATISSRIKRPFLLRKLRRGRDFQISDLVPVKSSEEQPEQLFGTAVSRTNSRNSRRNSIFDETAGATGRLVEDFFGDLDEQPTKNLPSNLARTKAKPRPAAGPAGTAGLLESCPYELAFEPEILHNIEQLNALPWRKYVCQFTRMHSHAEIINRRNHPGQGEELQRFFALQFKELFDA